MFNHRVKNRQEFAHTSEQCNFGRFSSSRQSPVKFSDLGLHRLATASRDRLLEQWLKYPDGGLAGALKSYRCSLAYGYDWSLNDAEAKP